MGTMQSDELIVKEHEAWMNGRDTAKATQEYAYNKGIDSAAGVPAAAKAYVKSENNKATQYYATKNNYSGRGGNGMPSDAASKQDKANADNRKYNKTGGNGMPSDVAITQDAINAAKRTNVTHVDLTKTTSSSSSSSSSTTKKAKDLAVGDKVQIKDGGIDVPSGGKARKGKMYGESGPYWLTVTDIIKDYATGSKYGLPAKITLVKCSDKGEVLWEVADTDIYRQTIKTDKTNKKAVTGPAKDTKKGSDNTQDPNTASKKDKVKFTKNPNKRKDYDIGSSNGAYAPDSNSDKWYVGFDSTADDINVQVKKALAETAEISDSIYDVNVSQTPAYVPITSNNKNDKNYWNDEQYRAMLYRQGYDKDQVDAMVAEAKRTAKSKARLSTGAVYKAEYLTNWHSDGRKAELLNDKKDLIQNQYGYPVKKQHAVYNAKNVKPEDDAIHNLGNKHDIKCAKYDYQIVLDDTRLKGEKKNFEDRLCSARASLGIPVHGSKYFAKSMKMYMYNRFKVPDTNLALSKTVTHVFFTRPDLNILDESTFTANWQTRNHTDSALIWKTHPELFKLLTDYRRCGDHDNLNLLLSNNIMSFTIEDENLDTNTAGQSWAKHEIVYGEQYSGRNAGEFSCTFTETSDLSIIHLMKLWVTYIDNVGRGAWSPYYYTTDGGMTVKNKKTDWCHVYDRALDYAASVYVFVCGPDGEDVLYWTKYYGVFPVNTGSSALSWNNGPDSNMEKLNIKFAYSCKKDLSPISLLEFNNVANTAGSIDKSNRISNVPSFDSNVAGSSRPFVGSPYIEIDIGNPEIGTGEDVYSGKETHIRLKHRYPEIYSNMDGKQLVGFKDSVLYRTHYSNDKTENATA